MPGPTVDVHTAAGVDAAAGVASPSDIPARIKQMSKRARTAVNSSIPEGSKRPGRADKLAASPSGRRE